MHRHIRTLLFLGALLLLYPLAASAKYLIEFADGQRMTVSNYEEAGDTVKVHTSLGSFAFRKGDVVNITNLDPGQKKQLTAEKNRQSNPTQVKKEEPQIAALQEKPTNKPTPVSGTNHSSKEMQDFMSQVEDGLFRMRYVFALIIGLKVFKIFFAASVR